jgi:predicted kinase
MPKCYQLIGIPGSGKSTWVHDQEWFDKCSYISTDTWVELEAKKLNKTYSDIFTEYMPTAVHIMTEHVKLARDVGQDIIWDQTSTTIASRKKKFNMLPDYEHIAVVFRIPEANELMRRLASRPGKNIPLDVIELMVANWEDPSKEEGFSEIWFAR